MPEGGANPGRRRLTAVVAGISLAISILFGLDLSDYRHQAIEKAQAVSDNMTRLLSERLDGSVRETDYVLRDVVDKVRSDTRGPELRRVVDAKRLTLKQASSLSVLDPWGRELASSPPAANHEAERSCVAVFAADGSLGATTLAVFGKGLSPGLSPGAGGSALIRSRAIRDADGSLVAVVSARIDVSVVQGELADLDLGEHRIIAVTDSSLRLIARRPEMPDAIGVEVVDAAMRGLLRQLKDSSPELVSMRSETGPYDYFARVGEFPFFVVIGQAKSDIMAEWSRRFVVYGAALAAIIALLLVLVRLLSKNFTRSAELAARLVAMESASDVIVIADLDGKVEYVNASYERTTGVPRAEALGSRRAIFGLDEAEADVALAAAGAGKLWRGEIDASRADGGQIVEEVTIAPVPGPGGEPMSIVAVLRDVTERRRLQEKLERLAHYDSLTALPNRTLFFDRLESAVLRARREERRFALLFLDLDGFKAVNDRFGHDAGDFLLFEIAKRLRSAIRDSDTAGRMGGDEFTVLLENISKVEDAAAVADKIRGAIVEPAAVPSGAKVEVGASIGIAVFPDDGADSESILKAADSAMYAIKLAAGDRR
jgi:diguanylate cyclase (GGDEF)-like protein/PAS domain S-box-containing protein